MASSRQSSTDTGSELNNQDIFLYALYRLDGAGQFVDVEDVVEECWRLSPSRFGWRKLQYPSDRTGWAAVGHIEAGRSDVMIKTPNGLGRQLTAFGVEWVRSKLSGFERLGGEKTRAPKSRRASFKLIADFARHPWVVSVLAGDRSKALDKVAAADLLRCAPDSSRDVWALRLASLRSAAADNERPDVLALLDEIKTRNAGWFSEVSA